jgi:hypothetical protein
LIGLLIAVGVAVDSLRHGNLLYIATTRQNFFVQNPLLNIAIGTLFPAFVIFGARRGLTAPVILGAAVVISIQFILGTRGQILATLIALTFWTAQRYRFIKLPIIYATLPILGYLLVFYRYIARDRVFFNSFGKFLEVSGGVSGVIFRSVDVPNAEIHAIALSNGHILRRAPWDWLLGALLAPVPRAWAPFKPLGPSSQFTLESVPLRYLLYRSELVVTGPIGIYFDVGYVGAILITAFLFFLWARMLLRSSTKQWAAMFGPIGIMVCYQFLRNDFYNTALMIWPTALAFCIFGVISKFRQIKNSAPTACSVGFDGAPR